MKDFKQKKTLVKELEIYFKKLNVQRLYGFPNQKDTKDWLAEVASIFKHLSGSDYKEFQNYRQHLYGSIPRETRKHVAEQIEGFTREKVAEWKRHNFEETTEVTTSYIKQEIIEGFVKKSNGFDYKKLIKLFTELNSNYAAGYQYSSSMIIRAIFDHIPPLLGFNSFDEVVNNYSWSRTDKEYMKKLLDFKNEGDDALHRQISQAQDLLQIENLPGNNRVNRLLQECLTNGIGFGKFKQNRITQPIQKNMTRKIEVKILENKVRWANFSLRETGWVWSSFRIDLEIDNYNNDQPDYVTVALRAKITDGEWNATHFIFENMKDNKRKHDQPLLIERKEIKQIGVFISDTEVGSQGQHQMPNIDTDTMELIIKTRSNQNLYIPIKGGWITKG
ncbi:hypothetical protein COY89_01390 [Candidatus Roizmanbacteria bacterium CG_4_10_14_0_8_um_filter_36_36]|nr:MAG: hypothetical protein COY89_01390 [Candidatus Roizmanbacteria bacterium CG_4_10_14_0_8_um_filter_36_36]